MKLTIVAATGGIGRLLVGQALVAGHDVTAVVRSPERLEGLDLRIVRADLMTASSSELAGAVRGSDAVLSTLGPRNRSEGGVVVRGTRAIIGGMQATGVERLVLVSAAPLSTMPSPARPRPPRHDPGEGFFMRHLLTPFARRMFAYNYRDLAEAEDAVLESGLDWTVVRPPRLVDRPLTATYRTAYGRNLRRGLTISRADVAHYMLTSLFDPSSSKQFVGIAD